VGVDHVVHQGQPEPEPAPGLAAARLAAGEGVGVGGQRGDEVADQVARVDRRAPRRLVLQFGRGKIVDVVALRQPNGNDRDQEINPYAIPQLHDEVLSAQSAHIDAVSGATVTSNGYPQSLQSTLDVAHFK